jgi:hypothetical protein
MRLFVLDAKQHHATGNGWDTQKGQYWTFALEVSGKVRASNGSNDLNSSKRNVEKYRLEGIEAERLNDERPESGDAATWNSNLVRTVKTREFVVLTRWKKSTQTRTMSSRP